MLSGTKRRISSRIHCCVPLRPRQPAAERRAGLAACFARVAYKITQEWKEEIVPLDPTPAPPQPVTFPDGSIAVVPAGGDPRVAFADWLTGPGRNWFAAAAVNRIWAWLIGRGLVHETDDLRPDNPSINPELTAFLSAELIARGYDLRHVYRLILTSRAYQRASAAGGAPAEVALGARARIARLDAEVLIDAINDVAGDTEHYSSAIPAPFTFIPDSERSVDLADGSISSPSLELFGRLSRDSGLAEERATRLSPEQVLHLMNSTHVQRKIAKSERLIGLARAHKHDPAGLVERLYLLVLSRRPSVEESRTAAEYLRRAWFSNRAVMEDLVWALINSKEFLYRH